MKIKDIIKLHEHPWVVQEEKVGYSDTLFQLECLPIGEDVFTTHCNNYRTFYMAFTKVDSDHLQLNRIGDI